MPGEDKPEKTFRKVEKYSDFAPRMDPISGDRVTIRSIINLPIVVKRFRLLKSKHHEGDYAIVEATQGTQEINFSTSSKVLMDQLEKAKDHMPFEATIVTQKNYYTFT